MLAPVWTALCSMMEKTGGNILDNDVLFIN